MKSPIHVGLGPKGILGAVIIGIFVFLPPILFPGQTGLWSQALLILATFVYVAFAIAFDHNKLALTILQAGFAILLVGLSVAFGSTWIVVCGLLAHAVWDAFHLTRRQRYAPWWYAGACIYVDVAAAAFLILR